MFNKYRAEKPSKIVIARIDAASKLVLRYSNGVFVPIHTYRYKSTNKDNNTSYKNTSLHSKPFWEQ